MKLTRPVSKLWASDEFCRGNALHPNAKATCMASVAQRDR